MMAIGIFACFFSGLFMNVYEGQSVALRSFAAIIWGGSLVITAIGVFQFLWMYLP